MRATLLLAVLLGASLHAVAGFRAQPLPKARLFGLTRRSVQGEPVNGEAISKAEQKEKGAVVGDLPGWDPTNWVTPAVWNKQAFRAGAIAVAILAVRKSSSAVVAAKYAPALAGVHLFAFSYWFGSQLYTTFVAGITMYKNLPRQTFGKLQAKLFPKYFAGGSISLLAMLATTQAVVGAPMVKPTLITLGVALGANLVNQWFLEPKATDVMMRRYEMENENRQSEDEYKKLAASFGKFHGLSSLVNLVSLCAAFVHTARVAAVLAAGVTV